MMVSMVLSQERFSFPRLCGNKFVTAGKYEVVDYHYQRVICGNTVFSAILSHKDLKFILTSNVYCNYNILLNVAILVFSCTSLTECLLFSEYDVPEVSFKSNNATFYK